MNDDLPIHICARCGLQYTGAKPWTAWKWTLCRTCHSDTRRHGMDTALSETARVWLAQEIELAMAWRRAGWRAPEGHKP